MSATSSPRPRQSRGVPVPHALAAAGLAAFRVLPRPVRVRLVRLGTPNYTAGALVLVRRGGEILLVEQRHTGQWALPGGLLMRGETALDAVRRELAEELGRQFAGRDVGHAVGVLVDPTPQRIDVLYALDVPAGTPAPDGASPEVLATGWYAVDALPAVTSVTPMILAEYARIGALRAR